MIVFDLSCDSGHRFEGWFGSSGEFERQCENKLLACPECGSEAVGKAPMAPAVPAKGQLRDPAEPQQQVANAPVPPEVRKAFETIAKAQAKALEKSTWVGGEFAEKSRQMHYGETDHAIIHGTATPQDAKALAEEGVPVAPLLVPVVPPEEAN